MIGSYDQVLEAAAHPPVEYYSFLLTSLLATVRLNIAECVAASFQMISISSLTQLLMFSADSVLNTQVIYICLLYFIFVNFTYHHFTVLFVIHIIQLYFNLLHFFSLYFTSLYLTFTIAQETQAFIAEKCPDWAINGSTIEFRTHKSTISEDIPSERLIAQNLSYATELERII